MITSEFVFTHKNTGRKIFPCGSYLIVEPNFAINQRDWSDKADINGRGWIEKFFGDKRFGLSFDSSAERAQIIKALFDADANGAVFARAVVICLCRDVGNRQENQAYRGNRQHHRDFFIPVVSNQTQAHVLLSHQLIQSLTFLSHCLPFVKTNLKMIPYLP